MSTIITSESFRSSDSEWKECSLEEKINALEYLSNDYGKYLKKAKDLMSAIRDYGETHDIETTEMKRKLRHIKEDFKQTQIELRKICDDRLVQVKEAVKPYTSHTEQKQQQQQQEEESGETSENLKNRLIELLSKISGIEGTIRREAHISESVRNDHLLLGTLEVKQKDAISRFEEVTRVQNLAYDVSEDNQLYNLANAPSLLLALSASSRVSSYYSTRLKSLQQRLSSLVAQIRFNSQKVFGSQQTTRSTKMSNGEISAESLIDTAEHPIDSLTSVSRSQK